MNLSAINYERLEILESLTSNHLQAKLLDRFLYWWQFSKYTLNDNQKWFTRSVSAIAEATNISVRSVARYMKKFEQEGLIERRCILLRKKNLYIRITEKLLALIEKKPKSEPKVDEQKPTATQPEAFNLVTEGSNETAPLAVPIISNKEHILKNNSTVRQNGIVNNSNELIKTTKPKEQINEFSNCEYKIEKEIGERVTTRFKNYVKGVITNLKEQYSLKISNPDKLFAEIIFSVTNKESHFAGVEEPHHRVNIIAKLLREKRWKTPKGFYNHWDIGQSYREKEDVKQRKYEACKQEEGIESTCFSKDKTLPFSKSVSKQEIYKQAKQDRQRQSAKREIEIEIASQKKHLSQLERWLDEGRNGISQAVVDSCAIKIASLFDDLLKTKQS